jgi:hypothetical protein
MRKPATIITIDRLVLTGLGVTREQAERVRSLLETELQRSLAGGRGSENLAAGVVSHLEAPPLELPRPYSDEGLAYGLAQSLSQSLRQVKGE